MKRNTVTNSFLGNSTWMIVQQIYSMLLQLVIGSLSARYLGPSNYGLINYGASIISIFTIVCQLGLNGVIINEMIKAPEKRVSYLGSALVMRLSVSVVSLFSIAAIVAFLEPENKTLHVVTFLQSFAVILQTYEVFTYWFQLNLRMKYVSIATMVAQTIVGIWRIVLLATNASVYYFAVSSSIQYFVCGIVVILCFKYQNDGIKLSFSVSDSKYLLSHSYHFIISGIAVTLYSQIDKVMIGKILTDEAVGLYTAAATIAMMWEFVPNALINSARPLIIELRKKDYKKYIIRFQQLLLAITVLSVVVGFAIILLGKFAITVLYGIDYKESVLPLYILIWSTGFAVLGNARAIWIVAEGYNKYAKYYTFLGAFVNFFMNLLFIPFCGIVGASITTLVSQIFVALIFPLLFRDTRQFVVIYFKSFKQIRSLITMAKEQLSRK